MTYELAKKLQDAGFETKQPRGYYFVIPGKDNSCGSSHYEYFDYEGGPMYQAHVAQVNQEPEAFVPFLSELIEACRSAEGEWMHFFLMRESNHWNAGISNYGLSKGSPGTGSTPEEAVANLWLVIQERKTSGTAQEHAGTSISKKRAV